MDYTLLFSFFSSKKKNRKTKLLFNEAELVCEIGTIICCSTGFDLKFEFGPEMFPGLSQAKIN